MIEPEKKVAKPVETPVEEMTVEECMAWLGDVAQEKPISTEEAIAIARRVWGDTPPISHVPSQSSD